MVGPQDSVTCVFNNVSDDVPPSRESKFEKSGPAQAHEGDKVTYEFTVTNTGETTLENIKVTDDVLGDIGTVASLAPGSPKHSRRSTRCRPGVR